MAPWWWSWLLAGVGLVGLWLAGSKNRAGWAVGVAAQALWISYALVSHQHGFLASAAGYGFVYLRNWWAWRTTRQEQPRTPAATAADPAPPRGRR